MGSSSASVTASSQDPGSSQRRPSPLALHGPRRQDDLEEVRVRERVIVRHWRQVTEVDEAEHRQGVWVHSPPRFLKHFSMRGPGP